MSGAFVQWVKDLLWKIDKFLDGHPRALQVRHSHFDGGSSHRWRSQSVWCVLSCSSVTTDTHRRTGVCGDDDCDSVCVLLRICCVTHRGLHDQHGIHRSTYDDDSLHLLRGVYHASGRTSTGMCPYLTSWWWQLLISTLWPMIRSLVGTSERHNERTVERFEVRSIVTSHSIVYLSIWVESRQWRRARLRFTILH